MSQNRSPSLARCYGMVRVARVWKIPRASVYRSRKEMPSNTSGRRPGPGGACSDAELAELGRGTGRAYPPAHRRLPPSRRGLPQVMGAVALCRGSHQPPSCATGDARERPAGAASR
jgi:hypothetical protein